MTLRPALARFERGFRRMGAWALDPLQRRRRVTEGQEVTAQETRTMLGLMAQANSAGAAMSDEQRLMLIQAAPGMRAREAVLLSIPNRSTVEENELHMIRREMAALEGRDVQPRRFLPALPAASPVLAVLLSPYTWLVALGAFCVLQMGLKERVENQRDEARRELSEARESLEASVALTERLQRDINAANRDSAQTAATIEAERARRLAAERQARRIRDEMARARAGAGSVDYGFGSVRDDGAVPPGAGGGDAAGRDPG